MNIGLFGGSFDPIHRGHLALAEAAASRYSLRQVLFVPANIPPHKQKQALTAFVHRYAMVALATQKEREFIPSLLEAAGSEIGSGEVNAGVNYSIDTVRRLKKTLKKADRLFFLIGIDAFREVAKWREPRALLAECEFIVASRPGYSLRDVAESLPEDLRPSAAVTRPFHKQPAKGDLVLPGAYSPFAGGHSPQHLCHRDSSRGSAGKAAGAMARHVGGGLYQEAGPVPGQTMTRVKTRRAPSPPGGLQSRSLMTKKNDLKRQVNEAILACHDKQADDVAILELEKDSGAFTDYFVMCSGTNPRQIQAIADAVDERLEGLGLRVTHSEGYKQAEWVLLDYVDFVVHIFSEKARQLYDLERLWKSAKRLTPAELMDKPKRVTTIKPATIKPARVKAASADAAPKKARKKRA